MLAYLEELAAQRGIIGGELEILSGPQGTTIIGTVPFQAEKTNPRDGR